VTTNSKQHWGAGNSVSCRTAMALAMVPVKHAAIAQQAMRATTNSKKAAINW